MGDADLTSSSQKSVVIIGAGGHAKVVADTCRSAGIAVHGFVVPDVAAGAAMPDGIVLGGDEYLDSLDLQMHGFVVAIGGSSQRRKVTERLRARGGRLMTVVHPSAVIGARAALGEGVLIFAGAVIICDCQFGDGAIINTGARVDHECRIGEGAHICPGAILGGEVEVGAWTVVGPGATIVKGKSIGSDSVIGAGAVVTRNIPDRVTGYGNPCRIRT